MFLPPDSCQQAQRHHLREWHLSLPAELVRDQLHLPAEVWTEGEAARIHYRAEKEPEPELAQARVQEQAREWEQVQEKLEEKARERAREKAQEQEQAFGRFACC
jgi:hypothetical protein